MFLDKLLTFLKQIIDPGTAIDKAIVTDADKFLKNVNNSLKDLFYVSNSSNINGSI